jgi:4-diphosphocytidyl-2-C-methyl-D-erythritol kinase
MNTKLAYQYVKASVNTPSPAEVVQLPVNQWKSLLINDFEMVVTKIHPIVGELKAYFYQLGATYAAMSGSGTAVFGLFEKEPHLDIYIPFLRKYSF